MTAKSQCMLLLCLGAGLLSSCSRSGPPAASAPAPQTPASTTAPLATEASVTTAAPPVPDLAAPKAVPVPTPPEDRMEPASLENARLPGGGKLQADPVPPKRGN